jgi:light-regulated signal transduction histidine kinase (bacteriophytochrome)
VDVAVRSLPWAEVDVTRIAQVLANLLNNAAKYTPPGGRIVLSLREDGDFAVISVADTGVGIQAESAGGGVRDVQPGRRDIDRAGRPGHRPVAGAAPGRDARRQRDAASPGLGAGSTFTVRLPLVQPHGARRRRVRGRTASIRSRAAAASACWWWMTMSTRR